MQCKSRQFFFLVFFLVIKTSTIYLGKTLCYFSTQGEGRQSTSQDNTLSKTVPFTFEALGEHFSVPTQQIQI